MSRDDSLSRQIAGDKRRKRKNLVATNPSGGSANIVTDPAALSGTWCAPTDELKVMDLRFVEKYPKIDTNENSVGTGTPKADPDGTIELSRRIWDASVKRLHHRMHTNGLWLVGPDGDELDPNPFGDWVGDWPRPVPGVRGWASRFPAWGDYLLFGNNTWPQACIAYHADDVADIRGPDGEFDQMESFTYIFWVRPILETFWDHYLAAVYDDSTFSIYDSDLGIQWTQERAGFRFFYRWSPGGTDHSIEFASEAIEGSYSALWRSGDGGKCDLSFGEAVDEDLHDIGYATTVPAFVALVVGPVTGEGAAYLTNFESGGTDNQTFADAPTFFEMARSFTPANDQTVTAVSLRLQQRDGVSYTDERLKIEIYTDSGGSGPDTKIGGFFALGYIPAVEMPTSAASPAWVRCVFDEAVDLTASTRYWIHITPNSAIDASHRIDVWGTDDVGEVDPSEETRWYRTGDTWDAVDVDIDFRVEGVASGGTVSVDVYTGNPRTGVLNKLGAEEAIVSGSDVDASAVPAPKEFSVAENQTQHVIGSIRQHREYSLNRDLSNDSAMMIFDAAVRHNRALTLPEIRGAFASAMRHEWESSTPGIVSDVDNTGESASEVSAP